ncbi:MAG: aminotransferase class V-fold PLP-dependent enzyme, partial [Planctomycetota bacterium]
MQRIYLDNAATSFPKPPGVCEAMQRYQRELGAPAGRGGYMRAVEVTAAIDRTRKRVADLLGAPAAERIVFAFNGTDALNMA